MTELSPQAQGPEQDSVAFEDPAYRAAAVDLLVAITTERYLPSSGWPTMPSSQSSFRTSWRGPRWHGPVRSRRAPARAHRRPRRGPDRGDGAVREPFDSSTPRRPPATGWRDSSRPRGRRSRRRLYVEIAAYLDAGTRSTDRRLVGRCRHADFVVDRVRRAIEKRHRVGGRLALWGRRLMGEALSQAQRVQPARLPGRPARGRVDMPGWTSRHCPGCSDGSPRTSRADGRARLAS